MRRKKQDGLAACVRQDNSHTLYLTSLLYNVLLTAHCSAQPLIGLHRTALHCKAFAMHCRFCTAHSSTALQCIHTLWIGRVTGVLGFFMSNNPKTMTLKLPLNRGYAPPRPERFSEFEARGPTARSLGQESGPKNSSIQYMICCRFWVSLQKCGNS